ncbi:hypothetical protein SS50377_28082 [Spironucleus salmonicida]|uniref:Uncharacterized protein n=1 Tax=Spironucleus salmonicida TaxID=348837 RepID=V6LED1_9EUKA|nr:hypothetical protein SS50377_28082 [Spironucleus salmonicida]|eukprot:EST42633.1 hypothetical protein SS50377_17952 [Spironucleus salmonicida]
MYMSSPTPGEFMTSSQSAAMVPQLNCAQGPQLVKISDYPTPTYKTIQPIFLQQGRTETVTVTFLSHNANNCMVDVSGDFMIAATTSLKFMQRLDYEAYGVDVLITGLHAGQAKATITIGGCLPPITVFVEVIVTSPPYVPTPQPPAPQVLPVSTSVRGSMVGSQCYTSPSVLPVSTSVRNSMTGSGMAGSGMYMSGGRW